MIDLPLDVPPQYTPVVIAQAPQAPPQTKKMISAKVDRIIGVCHLIQNPPIPPLTAVNSMSPVTSVWGYLKEHERLSEEELKDEMYGAAKVTVVQEPEHGTLKEEWGGNYRYHPTPDYYGTDRATLLVKIGDIKVQTVFFFRVATSAWGGTEGYDPYLDEENCPNGPLWKIVPNSK